MASLLGEYLNTYQRANPAQGLLQGFQTGSNFMFALNQQKMQQEQFKKQEAERDKQNDIRDMTILLDAAKLVKSKAGQSQILQRFFDKYGKHKPDYAGIKFDLTDTANNFLTKARGLKKLGTENPDLFIKEIDNLIKEAYEEESKGNLEKDDIKGVVDTATGVKNEVAAELGGLASYPEQFKGEPAYETPQAKSGISGYQNRLVSQMTSLDPDKGLEMERALQKREESENAFKTSQYMRGPDGRLYGIAQDKEGRPKMVPVSGSSGMEFVDKVYKPIPDRIMDTFTDTQNLLNNLDIMLANNSKAGLVKGWGSKALAYTGNDQGAADFMAAYNQARLSGQSLVKGIPSDKDTQIVNSTLSKLTNDPKFNEALIKRAKQSALRSYRNRVKANQKFYALPPDIINTLDQYSSDVSSLDKPVKKSVTEMSDEELLNSL